jgi:hypothetical protein
MAVPAPIPATNTRFSLAIAGLLGALAALIAALPITFSAGLFAASALGLGVLLQPGLGVIALALALPFGSLWTLPPWGANAVDLLVAVVVVAWALKGMAARDWRIAMPVPAWPLLAFIWVAALSLTQAPSWREGVPEWFKWAEVAVVYIVGAQVLTRRQAWWMAAALLAAGALEAALGAYQFLRQVGPEAFILLGASCGRMARSGSRTRMPVTWAIWPRWPSAWPSPGCSRESGAGNGRTQWRERRPASRRWPSSPGSG